VRKSEGAKVSVCKKYGRLCLQYIVKLKKGSPRLKIKWMWGGRVCEVNFYMIENKVDMRWESLWK